ncbi:MAG TPA: TadE/TadG family type IV pilus assembly protein, partial [Ilumatobacteraceae bacterium]|nr:TadE/TadG family type IV pilus assembly protein [Ilumatobacteraceae bacterium]
MSPHRRDHGQSTVELALAMPLVCMLLLAVVQLAVVVRDRLAVADAARVGARAAAVSANPSAAGSSAALGALGAAVGPGRAVVGVHGQLVTV